MLGILLIDKPAGRTSHDVVDAMRRRFNTRRVGHAGTLDPLATGLLVVAIGSATRFLQYLPLEPKHYEGEITFGQCSATYDAEGELSEPGEVPDDLAARLSEIASRFKGLIQQLPPAYSAVKVAGKPLYAYARKGQEAPREPRTVHVDRLALEPLDENRARIEVVCSGGTYVRTLAHDIGEVAGCGAYLSGLRRTGAGVFRVEDAVALDSASPDNLLTLAQALPPMPLVELTQTETESIRMGRRVGILRPPAGPLIGLLDPQGKVFGVARVDGHELQPECVIPLEAAH